MNIKQTNELERASERLHQCFGIRFSAVLYITNAPSIQMIQHLLGSPVVYQFYDMRFFVREASFPPVLHNFLLVHNLLPQSTLIFWRKLCNTGGTVSYKKKVEIPIYSFK